MVPPRQSIILEDLSDDLDRDAGDDAVLEEGRSTGERGRGGAVSSRPPSLHLAVVAPVRAQGFEYSQTRKLELVWSSWCGEDVNWRCVEGWERWVSRGDEGEGDEVSSTSSSPLTPIIAPTQSTIHLRHSSRITIMRTRAKTAASVSTLSVSPSVACLAQSSGGAGAGRLKLTSL